MDILSTGEVIDHGAETLRLDLGERTLNLAPYNVDGPPPPRRPAATNAEAETAIVRLPEPAAADECEPGRDDDIDVPLDAFDPGGYPPRPRPTPPPPPAPKVLIDTATTVTQMPAPDVPPAWSAPAAAHPTLARRSVPYVMPEVWEWRGPKHRSPDPAPLRWLIAAGALLVAAAALGIVITAVMS